MKETGFRFIRDEFYAMHILMKSKVKFSLNLIFYEISEISIL